MENRLAFVFLLKSDFRLAYDEGKLIIHHLKVAKFYIYIFAEGQKVCESVQKP